MLFFALATAFAQILRPLAPSQAATTMPVPSAPVAQQADIVEVPSPVETVASDAPEQQHDTTLSPIPDGPLVAIILTELGPNAPAATQAIERLPSEISFAFSPYPEASRALAQKAKAEGHEVWLSVPMQPKSYPRVNPGANVLLTGQTSTENILRLEWALGRIDKPIGITNMMGSAFTENRDAMRPILGALDAKKLLYVDARSSGRSIGEQEARAIGIASVTNDRFIDEPETPENIRKNLAALLQIARRSGQAIGYARAVPQTIAELERWSAELKTQGVTLVSASTVARKNSDG